MRPSRQVEEALAAQGYHLIAGVDEVGRGPLVGPVVAAAVILPPGIEAPWLSQVRDSKQVPAPLRGYLCQRILGAAVAVGTGRASAQEIDEVGLLPATRRAMAQAVAALTPPPDYVLVDAVPLPEVHLPFKSLVRGDQTCLSIAAASIVAKVTRDHLMEEMDRLYPGYGLARHKGYPTREHLECLHRLGPCPLHRRSFAPVREALGLPEATRQRGRQRLGTWGERLAREHLVSLGYRIRESNYRLPGGEVDIIAEHDGCLVFVEVRSRRSHAVGTPAESVTPAKLNRLVELAQAYLQAHPEAPADWRIDVVTVDAPRGQPPRIEVIPNVTAWQ